MTSDQLQYAKQHAAVAPRRVYPSLDAFFLPEDNNQTCMRNQRCRRHLTIVCHRQPVSAGYKAWLAGGLRLQEAGGVIEERIKASIPQEREKDRQRRPHIPRLTAISKVQV